MPDAAAAKQTFWSVVVRPRTTALDGHGRSVLGDIRQLGLSHIEGVRSARLYLFNGSLTEADATLLSEQLLTDPVVEMAVATTGLDRRASDHPAIEVQLRPGVMDPAALSTLTAARRLLRDRGSTSAHLDEVKTARRYEIMGARDAEELETIARRILANDCIEAFFVTGFDRRDSLPASWPVPPERPFELRHVKLQGLDDAALSRLSREGHLFLSLAEMRTIQAHFETLGRDPTDLELETLAQTWSEHCVHKTLKSEIEYTGEDFGKPGTVTVRFENLLKETIAHATHALDKDWCLSVFVDNAGVIALDDEYGVAFKVETHNHPSAIEPYGGAATGVGGCIRDVMGCGLGAKPIASTDVFCLAPPDYPADRLPKDVLHPARVLKGVVRGVRDYGNRMGIPTVNGAIYFDDRYLANPLVFCGCVGLIPRDKIAKAPNPGDLIVVAGGRTGRDGIHGATFSSSELTDTHADEFSHAVQIGNAIEEKKLLDAQLIARDHPGGCLYSSVTDCGAGGLSSAVGEMGATLGAEVDLEHVPLKYAGLAYDEIWISEAQERMVFAVPPDRLDAFLKIFAAEEVEATVIGQFTNDETLHVRYRGEVVGSLGMRFLHEGLPRTRRMAKWSKPVSHDPEPQASACADVRTQTGRAGTAHQEHGKTRVPMPSSEPRTSVRADERKPLGSQEDTLGAAHQRVTQDLENQLLAHLSDRNVASKEWVIRQYDHEVQGRSVVKPLVGPGSGPSDAAVLRARYDRPVGIALGCGLCPHLSDVDPYRMAIAAVDEALRNVICVGANPDRTAILDNFCWPKADTEESLGALVRTCRGATDAAIAYGLPFISGKDSLNNEFTMSESEAVRTGLPRSLAIPPTLLISAIGVVEDVTRCVTLDLKSPGNRIILASAPVERVGLDGAKAMHDRVSALIRQGVVESAHDVSDGGLACAIAEMSIAGGLGVTVQIGDDADLDSVWAEPGTTYLLEMTEADANQSGLPIIGRVESEAKLRLSSSRCGSAEVSIDALARAWRAPLVPRWEDAK